ncbi:MAG: putative acetyl-CoA acyltransferase [Candidatus Omnitrophica bacterium ADurb.Bin292]|nr:MAG: putative acetyl-CoA acyltransferase [Candidatus Omnitrophica bacterium ADurb.Bin292]HPW76387.1 thiolase family protein [Candidatus Omnitrophota bacterium]HQB11992.1 thiolase family protein [Candidatus Omnitrophota bacterium]
MKDVVIAGACRTPIAKLGGTLKSFSSQDLGAQILRGLLERSKLDPSEVDEVILGCVGQQSDAHNVARVIAVRAGIPHAVPAYTVNRNCGSGLQSIHNAFLSIRSGESELIVAGGVEVMSASPFLNRDLRFGKKIRDSVLVDSLWEGLRDPLSGMMMGETAELLAKKSGIGRSEQDAFALESHQKACLADQKGMFKREIMPVVILDPEGRSNIFDRDEGPRQETSLEGLGKLSPVFRKTDGTVTAGNSSQISDGAAAVIVASREKARSLGLEVMATIREVAFSGIEPERMGLGPVIATKKALAKSGLSLKDIQTIEVNEAFAVQYLAVERELNLDRSVTNCCGGAIALGHPVGASGARIVVTLLYEMERRQATLGLATLCIGGGQGGSMVLERC